MLRLFLKTLMADKIYSAHSWEKITEQVKTQLSYKRKTISGILIAFLKST